MSNQHSASIVAMLKKKKEIKLRYYSKKFNYAREIL